MTIDQLPASIRKSKNLSAEQLIQLCAADDTPVVNPAFEDDIAKNIFQYYSLNPDDMEEELHRYAAKLLDEEKVYEAWQVLLTLV